MLKTKQDQEKLAYAIGILAATLPYEVYKGVSGQLAKLQQSAPDIAKAAFQALYKNVSERLGTLASTPGANLHASMEEILMPAYKQASEYGKLAAGRLRPLSEADQSEVDKQWAAEAKFVEKLARDRASGKISDAEFGRRIQMYGYALREVYNRAWAHHKTSPLFKWHMHEGAVHCVACIAAANESGKGLPTGFYRVGELPFYPGRSPVCLDNCMCWLEASDGDIGAPQIRTPAKAENNPEKET